jgi:sodium/calcium exchanger protein
MRSVGHVVTAFFPARSHTTPCTVPSLQLRGLLYIFALIYLFLGIAIIADLFMSAIEIITAKQKTVTRTDPETGEQQEVTVAVWNATVANLTLLALGSSAPEIMLATLETVQVRAAYLPFPLSYISLIAHITHCPSLAAGPWGACWSSWSWYHCWQCEL